MSLFGGPELQEFADKLAAQVAQRLPPSSGARFPVPSSLSPVPIHFGVTTKTPPSLRPFTAGLYISSACTGGRMNVPGVVARAT